MILRCRAGARSDILTYSRVVPMLLVHIPYFEKEDSKIKLFLGELQPARNIKVLLCYWVVALKDKLYFSYYKCYLLWKCKFMQIKDWLAKLDLS